MKATSNRFAPEALMEPVDKFEMVVSFIEVACGNCHSGQDFTSLCAEIFRSTSGGQKD